MKYIELIKAEIERLYEKYKDAFYQYKDDYHLGLCDGLDMAIRVIDSIDEQPSEDLERAAQHNAMSEYRMPDDGDIDKVAKVMEARIFHEIGFKAGAKWDRDQMLKGAEEGEVCILPGYIAYVKEKNSKALKQYLLDNCKNGDKVKIIIVKDD